MDSAQKGLRRRIASLAAQQAGLVTRSQAVEAGMSDGQFRAERAAGRWEPMGTSVFRIAGAPETWEQRVWAACLETRGVASHRTAGWIWRLDGLGRRSPAEIEVLVAFENKRTSDGADVRRSRTLLPTHVTMRSGIPRTNLARTVLDLSEVLDADALELAFDSALRMQADLRSWLKRLLRPLPRRGHLGIGRLAALLDETGLAVDSALEVKLRRLLRQAKLPTPQAGVDVVEDGEHVARLDFAWPGNRPRVALMAHGARWHANTRRWKRDLTQASQLTGLGWRVVQCSADDVERRPEALVENLRRALAGFDGSASIGRFGEL